MIDHDYVQVPCDSELLFPSALPPDYRPLGFAAERNLEGIVAVCSSWKQFAHYGEQILAARQLFRALDIMEVC
jgi:hypothetical protein